MPDLTDELELFLFGDSGDVVWRSDAGLSTPESPTLLIANLAVNGTVVVWYELLASSSPDQPDYLQFTLTATSESILTPNWILDVQFGDYCEAVRINEQGRMTWTVAEDKVCNRKTKKVKRPSSISLRNDTDASQPSDAP